MNGRDYFEVWRREGVDVVPGPVESAPLADHALTSAATFERPLNEGMPVVEVVPVLGPAGFARLKVGGFEELNVWAIENDPMWRQLSRFAGQAELSEVDRLRFLLGVMFVSRRKLLAAAPEAAAGPFEEVEG